MQSIRNFIENLKNTAEEYREIDAPVSSVHELTGAVYYLMQQKQNPAVMFNRVDENEIPVLTNLFSSRKRLALAVNTDEKNLYSLYREKESQRIPPRIVPTGPIQETVIDSQSVDLTTLPVITHNLKDKGPYITAGIMTVKDPDTGIRNSGIYRLMIKDRNHTGIHISETSHAYYIFQKYRDRKKTHAHSSDHRDASGGVPGEPEPYGAG